MKNVRSLAALAGIAALTRSGCAGVAKQATPAETSSAASLPNPGSPVSYIVPNAAGGAGDTIARLIAPQLEKSLGVKVQVINVDGAGGQLGLTQLASAKPDGHTIGFTNIPSAIGLYTDPARNAAFDRESFTPVAQLTASYLAVAVNSSSTYKTFPELIAAAKEKPGQITWATGGVLSNDHLAALDVEEKTGTDFNIVHLAGGSAKTTALLGSKVEVITGSGDALVTQSKAGTFRVLSILGPDKQEALPDVPTAAADGYDIKQATGFFVSAPAGTSDDIRKLYEKAFSEALKDPGVVEKMAGLGYAPKFEDGTAFGQFWEEQEKLQQPLFLEAAKEQK